MPDTSHAAPTSRSTLFSDNLTRFDYSYSSSQTFNACARLLEFRKFYPRTKMTREFDPEIGHAIHKGYQEWLRSGDKEKALWAMISTYPVDLNDGMNVKKSVEACFVTLEAIIGRNFFDQYEIATVKCKDGEVRPAIEVPFSILIKNFSLSDERHIPVYVNGYIDAILFHKFEKFHCIVEVKTTGWNRNDFTAMYKFDPQTLPYDLILQATLGAGIENLVAEYIVAVIDLRAPKIQRLTFEKDKLDVQDWARGLLIELRQIKMYYQMGWWKRNSQGCVRFNRVCPFLDQVCGHRDKEQIEFLLTFAQEVEEQKPFEPWIEIELELRE